LKRITKMLAAGGILLVTSGPAMAAGWYLIVPPSTPHGLNDQFPMSVWTHIGAYDTATECEDRLSSLRHPSYVDYQTAQDDINSAALGSVLPWELFKARAWASRCIASDDPALNK
jgi:hypothetical protein